MPSVAALKWGGQRGEDECRKIEAASRVGRGGVGAVLYVLSASFSSQWLNVGHLSTVGGVGESEYAENKNKKMKWTRVLEAGEGYVIYLSRSERV